MENNPVVLRSWFLVDCLKNAIQPLMAAQRQCPLQQQTSSFSSAINPIVLILCLCSEPTVMLKIMPAYTTQAYLKGGLPVKWVSSWSKCWIHCHMLLALLRMYCYRIFYYSFCSQNKYKVMLAVLQDKGYRTPASSATNKVYNRCQPVMAIVLSTRPPEHAASKVNTFFINFMMPHLVVTLSSWSVGREMCDYTSCSPYQLFVMCFLVLLDNF